METAARMTPLDVQISAELRTMLTQAAETLGCSVSDFVLNTLQDAAQHVMKNTEQTTVIHLSPQEQERVAEALLNPPYPNEALQRAFANKKRLLGDAV